MFFYTFIPKLLNMSLTASVAIVFVLLLRLMLKKAPKVISYALWSVVLFRLLCPVSIESSLSLFGLLDTPTVESTTLTSSIEYVPENIVHRSYPAVTLPVPGVSDAINNTLPSGREQLVADPLEAPVAIGAYVWMMGVLCMAAYSVVAYARLRRKLLTASPLRDNIYLADEIASPFVMGLFRPKIYLPSDMEEREQAYIIRHEQRHIRRCDHIIKALAFLALTIHWFNPLVWVAFLCSSRDMEMSCDEAVVKEMGDGILADYTASLLSLATGRRIIAGMPLAFGEGDTKGRIRNLANWRKPAFWVVLLAVVACIALTVGLLTNPAGDDAPDHSEDGYFLVIGADGVESIEVSGANSSGGVVNADGTTFKNGEKVWLEQLQGVTDLRGITITALGADGEIIYAFSVPEGASDAVITELVGTDPWLLAPTSFALTSEDPDGTEGAITPVKWTYSPMMSATWHAAFHFNFDVPNYSHIEASCDNGALWNLHAQGQPREKSMRFEQGEPLCWMPDIGEDITDTAENAEVTFTVYDGGEIVAKGVLDIVRTGTENGQSFYEAQLKDTKILALAQELDSLEATVVMAGNGTIVSYSDVNHNRINERVIVREIAPDMLYELCVVEDGVVIWSTEAGTAHVGWNTIMLYSEDGQDYLVRYQPAMFQGVGGYTCTVFSLDGSKENVKKQWSVEFQLPAEETAEMERFAQEVGILLRGCRVLLSTEQGIVVNQYAMASALPQLYPVRFDPDEIQAAIEGTGNVKELTADALQFPEEPIDFLFASGAGGWGTELTLNPDGSFTGSYSDSDMGSNTPEYPNGTRYVCEFKGQFSDIRQISDYAWSMKLSGLSTEKEKDVTWIEDGIRYVAADPYGVAGGEEFILYAPEAPADELTADCRSWWPDAYLWIRGEQEELNAWGLCNINMGEGFFTTWMS